MKSRHSSLSWRCSRFAQGQSPVSVTKDALPHKALKIEVTVPASLECRLAGLLHQRGPQHLADSRSRRRPPQGRRMDRALSRRQDRRRDHPQLHPEARNGDVRHGARVVPDRARRTDHCDLSLSSPPVLARLSSNWSRPVGKKARNGTRLTIISPRATPNCWRPCAAVSSMARSIGPKSGAALSSLTCSSTIIDPRRDSNAETDSFRNTRRRSRRAIQFYQTLFGWKFQKWDGPMPYWLISTGEGEPGINGGLMPRHHPGPTLRQHHRRHRS